MKTKYIYTIILSVTIAFASFAQQGKLEKANKEYERFAYIDAQKVFKKVAESGYKSADLFQKLGNSYYFNSDYNNAVKWYGKLMSNYKSEVSSEYYFRYAQSLKAVKNYEESDKYMEKFYSFENGDARALNYQNTPNYLERISFQSGRYKVKNIAANSSNSDFGPSYYGDKLVFASSRDTGTVRKIIHKWNDKPFLDLYQGTIDEKTADVASVKSLSSILNTKFHESTPVFTKDLKTVYFTRNNYNKGKFRKAANGINKLKIYRSNKNEAGNWSQPESLSINNDEYVVAHPALSADEKKLYFSSTMPGGEGLSDIYVVDIAEDGTFGKPINMGPKVNTEGVESFPFIGKKSNDLYFASNGNIGLGGLDLYMVTLGANNQVISELINLGEPANSPDDDFAFILDEETKTGYLSSNRPGGKGDDDIYKFTQIGELKRECKVDIEGVITNKISGELLPGTEVTLFDTSNTVIDSMIVGADAKYSFEADCDRKYFIRGGLGTYETNETLVRTLGEGDTIRVELTLVKSVRVAALGEDLAKILDLNPIYFDYDKSNIRKDAAVELAKVIAVMNEYPKMKIDVRSHTDSRGNDEYNKQLSSRRAESTIKYIVKKGGINNDRLTGKGYGESQLTNDCANGIPCSLQKHQKNRRSEFIITAQ